MGMRHFVETRGIPGIVICAVRTDRIGCVYEKLFREQRSGSTSPATPVSLFDLAQHPCYRLPRHATSNSKEHAWVTVPPPPLFYFQGKGKNNLETTKPRGRMK